MMMMINQMFILARKQGLWRALYDLVMPPIQRFLAVSLWNVFSNLLIPYSINQSKLNLPVFSTYSNVSLTNFGSPSRFSVLIFLPPIFFLNSFLGPSWFLHSRRKCFTFSIPRQHSHVGSSVMFRRFRWLFSRQWPVRSSPPWSQLMKIVNLWG